jgi:ribonuclease BN (tRNA processing enzyme)
MELTVLGSSGSFPTADECCSGFLVRHDGYTIWMDAGSGTMSALQRVVRLEDVDAILLSHRHLDHSADIHMWLHATYTYPLKVLPVLAPNGVADTLAGVTAPPRDTFFTKLEWREFEAGGVTELGPFRVEAFEGDHSTPNNALRLSAGGKTLAYTGDTAPADAVIDSARDADLFVCEATWLNEQAGVMDRVHSTCAEAGEMARSAGVGRLALTHLWPGNDRERSRTQAADTFGSEVELARELGTTTI